MFRILTLALALFFAIPAAARSGQSAGSGRLSS